MNVEETHSQDATLSVNFHGERKNDEIQREETNGETKKSLCAVLHNVFIFGVTRYKHFCIKSV
jgi:hypothetical protein